MITYFSTNTFLSDLTRLEKKRKNNYFRVRRDICTDYQDIEDIMKIVQKGTIIKDVEEEDRKILLKTRFPNSAMKEGKSGGFRTISIADIQKSELVFLTVYPKKGKFAKSDLTEKEYLAILEEYVEQFVENTLKKVDINNDLAVIDDN